MEKILDKVGLIFFLFFPAMVVLYIIIQLLKNLGVKMPKIFDTSTIEKFGAIDKSSYNQTRIFKLRWLIAILCGIVFLAVTAMLGARNKFIEISSIAIMIVLEEIIRTHFKKK